MGLFLLPSQCECRQDRVTINMDAFVEKYQVSHAFTSCNLQWSHVSCERPLPLAGGVVTVLLQEVRTWTNRAR